MYDRDVLFQVSLFGIHIWREFNFWLAISCIFLYFTHSNIMRKLLSVYFAHRAILSFPEFRLSFFAIFRAGGIGITHLLFGLPPLFPIHFDLVHALIGNCCSFLLLSNLYYLAIDCYLPCCFKLWLGIWILQFCCLDRDSSSWHVWFWFVLSLLVVDVLFIFIYP